MKCPDCLGPMEDVGNLDGQDDPGATTEWGCKNPRCLGSVWYRDCQCPQCRDYPRALKDEGGQIFLFCKLGHRFTHKITG